MRIYTLSEPEPCLAVSCTDDVGFIVKLPKEGEWPIEMADLIRRFRYFKERIELLAGETAGQARVPLAECRLAAPLRNCEKIICVGKNYADHAKEMGGDVPELPVIFSKFASAILEPHGVIQLPEISDQVDFEAELVVVIGKEGRNIEVNQAMSHVFGYCCGNDVSARDWQKGRPGGQWLLGKTFDTFAPLGPALVTADEIEDPHQLNIALRLNGETMQSSNTRELIFRIDTLIAHVSKFFTLRPGDLIFTGTPAGVGAGRNPQMFLTAGDELEVEIETLGVLVNRVNLSAS